MNKHSSINNENNKYLTLHKIVLNKIRPSKDTRAQMETVIEQLIAKTTQKINSLDLDYPLEPILVGSTAKDTYLSNPDIDLFIMFPTTISRDELQKQGLMLRWSILPDGEERYAEHPYITGTFRGFEADIVPCYKLNNINERMTAVDRTPFHTKFIVEHLTPEQFDEVRLLKQFMKGIGIYGAELEIQGFSGYLCELLILKYGNFGNLLSKVSSWENGLLIRLDDKSIYRSSTKIAGAQNNKSDLPKTLFDKFKDEPLVIIDPVDEERNVASAVSADNLEHFIRAAKSYIGSPRLEFFFPKTIQPLSMDQLRIEIENTPQLLLGLEFGTPDVIADILHGQLRKCLRAIQKLLDKYGFRVIDAQYYNIGQTLLLYKLEKDKLPEVEPHRGPPEWHENVNSFKAKWSKSPEALSKPYLKDHRWYVDIKREFIEPVPLLSAKLPELNVGKHVTHEIQKNIMFYQNMQLLKSGFNHALTMFLSDKYSWEY